jgi:hypothetical protein
MMLQRGQNIFLFTGFHSFIWNERLTVFAAEEGSEAEGDETGLEDAARTERDYLRQRLREELQREPTEQELDDYLRQHTEGY